MVLGDLNASEIQKALKAHPYQRFPVTKEGTLAGILTRKEAEAALAAKRAPRLEPSTTCQPGHTIRQLQALLIESSTGLVALTGADGQPVVGSVFSVGSLRSVFIALVCRCSSGVLAVVLLSSGLVSPGGSYSCGAGSFSAAGGVGLSPSCQSTGTSLQIQPPFVIALQERHCRVR